MSIVPEKLGVPQELFDFYWMVHGYFCSNEWKPLAPWKKIILAESQRKKKASVTATEHPTGHGDPEQEAEA